MPLVQPLSVFRQELQTLLLDDPAGALQLLQDHLPNGTAYFNTVVGLLARLNDANKARLRGTVSNEELQRLYNGIRADFLDLVNLLTEADFENAQPPAGSGKPGPKQGSVLYRIPHQMPLLKETKCVVRIAVDEDAIVENITIDQHVELKALKRVSDLMMVELTDPSADQHFQIRTTSTPEQIITEEGFSEWFFYVQPLHEGSFPLEVKVSVIELVMGREAKKEYVLSELVQIVAEASPTPMETPLKPAGVQLSLANTPEPSPSAENAAEMPPVTSPPSVRPPQQEFQAPAPALEMQETISTYDPPTPTRTGKGLKAVAVFLAFIVLGSATTWAVTPAATFDYWIARLENSETAYAGYLEKYPAGERTEEVLYRRAVIADQTHFYRQYLNDYGQKGKYKERISKRIDELETERFIEASKDPSNNNVRRFVADFPDTRRISELKKAIDAQKGDHTEVAGVLENTAMESIRRDPSETKIRQFIKDFPESTRLAEINQVVAIQPELQQQLQPELEDAWINKIQTNPTKAQVQEYLQQFPQPVKMEKLKKVIEDKPVLKKEMQGEQRLRKRQ